MAIGPPAREWFRKGYRRFTCHLGTLEDFLVPHVFGFRILFFSSNGSLYHTLAFNAAFADSTLGGACGLSCGALRQLCPPTCWLQLCARASACGGPRRTGDADPCRFASCESNCFCCHLTLCFHVFCACSQLADAATRFFIETSSFERLPPYSLLSEVHPMAYCDASQDCLSGFLASWLAGSCLDSSRSPFSCLLSLSACSQLPSRYFGDMTARFHQLPRRSTRSQYPALQIRLLLSEHF